MPGKFKETAYLPAQGLQEFVERSAEEQGMSKSRYLGNLVEKEAASVTAKACQPALVLHKPYIPKLDFVCSGVFECIPETTKSDMHEYVMMQITGSIVTSFREILKKNLKNNPEYINDCCFVLLRTLVQGTYKKTDAGSLSGRYDVKVAMIRVTEREWMKYYGRYDFFKIKYQNYYDLTTKINAGTTKSLVAVSDDKYKDGAFFIPFHSAGSSYPWKEIDSKSVVINIVDDVVAKCIFLGVDRRSVSERFSMKLGEKTNGGFRVNTGRRQRVFK